MYTKHIFQSTRHNKRKIKMKKAAARKNKNYTHLKLQCVSQRPRLWYSLISSRKGGRYF